MRPSRVASPDNSHRVADFDYFDYFCNPTGFWPGVNKSAENLSEVDAFLTDN